MSLTIKTVNQYISALRSHSPTPGGGSASALVSSLGISLGIMVLGILSKKKKTNQVKVKQLTKSLKLKLTKTNKLINQDAKAYQAVMKAYGLGKGNKDRKKKIETALKNAFLVMHELALLSKAAKKEVAQIKKLGSGAILNDVEVALSFLDAAKAGAKSTAKINLDYLSSKTLKTQLRKKYVAIGA